MSIYKINIVIVTYNSEKEINRCIDCIKNNKSSEYKINIFVIDNNSIDNTIKKLGKYGQEIHLLKNINNEGFAKAVNKILRKNLADYYLLINPDAFIKNDSIEKIVQCSQKHNDAICGGKTTNESGEIQGDHFRLPNLMVGLFDFTNLRKFVFSDYWHNYFYYLDKISTLEDQKVGCVTGGFMLISKKAINKIGYLDDRYFMYLEDVDYCFRAAKAGIDVIYCPTAIAIHIGGASSHNKERTNIQSWFNSRKRYFLTNHNIFENIIIQPIFIIDKIFISIKKHIFNHENTDH